MGWKKLIIGEKMPDKDDPKYKAQRESEVNAGREVAKALGVDKAAKRTQRVAIKYPKTFLVVVFGFVIVCLGYNVYQMVRVYNHQDVPQTAVERQDVLLRQRRKLSKPSNGTMYNEQEKMLADEVDAITAKGAEMTFEDSLRVKILLEQLVRINNLKQDSHDNR
ncbi:hypothetical protein [Bacteroides cellulosilyticus]|uniref:hypothetical protein n=1 Tax=Bacteroides cellulosilyticus TaxID=246787 RepID=UPI00356B5C2F